ncbi:hypothetical protein JXA32_11790 [Candidatus Sumerlaeota bacterium]|nr:hypothetical protein [Candidatus Sumerlaeota bacterium]
MSLQNFKFQSFQAGIALIAMMFCLSATYRTAVADEVEVAIEGGDLITTTTIKSTPKVMHYTLDTSATLATTPTLVVHDPIRIRAVFNKDNANFITHEISRFGAFHVFCDAEVAKHWVSLKAPDVSLEEAIQCVVDQGQGEWVAYNWRYKNTYMISHKDNFKKLMAFDCLVNLDPDPIVTKARIVDINVILAELSKQCAEVGMPYEITYQGNGGDPPKPALFLRSAPLSSALCRLALLEDLTVKQIEGTNKIILIQNKGDEMYSSGNGGAAEEEPDVKEEGKTQAGDEATTQVQ